MKPLTIDELKALPVGDWVWIVHEHKDNTPSQYYQIGKKSNTALVVYGEIYNRFQYSDYGTKWLAWKNKEQAEAKGEIVELPCIIPITNSKGVEVIFQLAYREESTNMLHVKNYISNNKSEAEARFAELKGETR